MKYYSSAIILISIIVLIIPVLAFANKTSLWPSGYWGPILSCSGSGGGGMPKCTSLCDLLATFKNIIYFSISLSIFVIAPLLIAAGGILIAVSGGNSSILEKGKMMVKGAVMGIFIILSAFVIVNTFITFIAKPFAEKSSWSEIQCNPSKIPGTLNSP